ncbi:MAG: MBL fold metallo-hydrolase, partial [Pseudomonadota bacterium]|nr:MBL fold metallo-hydrolase [Pseudomonadota bacterium]
MTNPYYDANLPHHTKDGFRNNYLTEPIGGSFLKWQWERTLQGVPKPPANQYQFPRMQPDLAWLSQNRSTTSATWIGHATVLMQVAGLNLITDPVFSERVSPLSFIGPRRRVPLPMTLAQLPHIDVVLISHNHYDHLDRASVQQLNRQAGGPPLFLVPLGIKPWMTQAGIDNVRELDWWQHTELAGLDLTFVPAQHWSARSLFDRFQTLWGG